MTLLKTALACAVLARISHQAACQRQKALWFQEVDRDADGRADCGLRWPRPRGSFGPVRAHAPSTVVPAMLSVPSTRTGPKSSAIITAPGEKCGLVFCAPLALARILCDPGNMIPFVPAAGWPNDWQGFVRLNSANYRSPLHNALGAPQERTYTFTAIDDAGNAYQMSVIVPDQTALHFNSQDLEWGNSAKGDLPGTGRHRRVATGGCALIRLRALAEAPTPECETAS